MTIDPLEPHIALSGVALEGHRLQLFGWIYRRPIAVLLIGTNTASAGATSRLYMGPFDPENQRAGATLYSVRTVYVKAATHDSAWFIPVGTQNELRDWLPSAMSNFRGELVRPNGGQADYLQRYGTTSPLLELVQLPNRRQLAFWRPGPNVESSKSVTGSHLSADLTLRVTNDGDTIEITAS